MKKLSNMDLLYDELAEKSKILALECAQTCGFRIYSLDEILPYILKLSPNDKDKLLLSTQVAYIGACYTAGDAMYSGSDIEKIKHTNGLASIFSGLVSLIESTYEDGVTQPELLKNISIVK